MNEYNSTNHCKYSIKYHLVWCPKFRFEVLNGDIALSLKDIIINICNRYNYKILELEVMPDHIHIFVSARPTVAPTDIVRTIKSISAIKLFKEHPKLKIFYDRCGSLWSKGYFVDTVGNANIETIRNYIKNQNLK
ncbi:IS200/IS605 family transposase [Halanaerobacter jeridensis]|uniref:Transposase n=1 Tax=Halanaerobacter jeridensis TaxID=706427 RepID=A0A938XT15_9FIRM|nr:IS200/IS605 family transposase [Halanaerobacter jeridensis]MBM7556339.1 putative transposase [Halanaerobacter jeridensis]